MKVATFRTDGNYKDGRRPEGVHFSSPQEDAQRRDFTVNALFYDMSSHQVLDFVRRGKRFAKASFENSGGGGKKISRRLPCAFCVRLACCAIGFQFRGKTFEALKKMASLVKTVSGERLRDEMGKLLKIYSGGKRS